MEKTSVDIIFGVACLELLANAINRDSISGADLRGERLDSLWIFPVVVDRAQQASSYIVVQPSTTPILFTQREALRSSTTDPIDDNLLQTVDVITSRVVSGGVELRKWWERAS